MTSDNPFREKSVAVTGKLNNYTRDGIKARLIALGARPVSKVSKRTDKPSQRTGKMPCLTRVE